jgi:hypothetical protein
MSATATSGGATVVRRFYELLGHGDVDGATALMHPELVIHEPAGLPYGGEYHGPAGFREITAAMLEEFETEPLGEVTCLDSAGPIVVQLVGRFTSRATGRSANMDVVELFTVRDGQIVDLDVYYRDPGAVAALVD